MKCRNKETWMRTRGLGEKGREKKIEVGILKVNWILIRWVPVWNGQNIKNDISLIFGRCKWRLDYSWKTFIFHRVYFSSEVVDNQLWDVSLWMHIRPSRLLRILFQTRSLFFDTSFIPLLPPACLDASWQSLIGGIAFYFVLELQQVSKYVLWVAREILYPIYFHVLFFFSPQN